VIQLERKSRREPPGQLGRDSQDRTAGTRQLGQDSQEKTIRIGESGQGRLE
jgi:hypothetical protein